MSRSYLKPRWKRLQAKIGVTPDGDPGPITLTRLEQIVDNLPRTGGDNPVKDSIKKPSQKEGMLLVSKESLDDLVGYEIGSLAYYEKVLARPSWPGWSSGVTIGVGYDLGYNTKADIENDWKGKVSDSELQKILSVAGIKKEAAKSAASKIKSSVKIPLDVARQVFYQETLPKFAKLTLDAFAGVEHLPPDAQGALLSLIFNRGSSMSTASRRREMREIRDILAKIRGPKDVTQDTLDTIAGKIRSMKRLWNGGGLLPRRDNEAKRVANSNRVYEDDGLVLV